jgi:HD-like signal output (HDOD) protein
VSDPISELNTKAQAVAKYIDNLSDNKIEVPMLPDVANRVLTLSNDPDSDAAQLAKLIQSDQALAGHVMRIANSAAYTPNASMVSLQQAVARLGMSLITEIALAASLNTKIFKAPTYENRINEIWDHALCTAFWGKEVARVAKKNVEAAFLCGLLHSIGKPVILQTIFDYSEWHDVSISLDEVAVLEETYHVKYGEVVVRKWKMPIIVQESVHYYLDYKNAQNNRDQAMVTNGATKLAKAMLSGDDDALDLALQDSVFADLNLYEDELETLKEKLEVVKSGLEAIRS